MANIFDRRMFDISRVRTYPEAKAQPEQQGYAHGGNVKATPFENEGYETPNEFRSPVKQSNSSAGSLKAGENPFEVIGNSLGFTLGGIGDLVKKGRRCNRCNRSAAN